MKKKKYEEMVTLYGFPVGTKKEGKIYYSEDETEAQLMAASFGASPYVVKKFQIPKKKYKKIRRL